jgi:hypothetical protein
LGSREREWGGKGEEGGQFTSSLGPEWTGVAPHAKEGVQVSKRDSGTVEGFSRQRGNYQGGSLRGYQGDCAMYSNIMSTLYISCYCVCVVLIKELCLDYK